jgi:single-strand DNA-binding protein
MIEFNKVIITGLVSRTTNLRTDRFGNRVCSGDIQNRRTWITNDKQQHEEIVQLPWVAWNSLAESMAKQVHEGDQVLLEGKLKCENWVDRDQLRSEICISATAFQLFSHGTPKG